MCVRVCTYECLYTYVFVYSLHGAGFNGIGEAKAEAEVVAVYDQQICSLEMVLSDAGGFL